MSNLLALLVAPATLSLMAPAQAHYVWLERDGDGPTRAYLGEWIDDSRKQRRYA